MTSLGEKLRTAREARPCTASEAAEATHIKIQTIEQLERNEFSKIPATIYGKGFIKIYAEFLGLDPAPLIAEYTERVAKASRPAPAPELPLETNAPRLRTAAAPAARTPVMPRVPASLPRTRPVATPPVATRRLTSENDVSGWVWQELGSSWLWTIRRTVGGVGGFVRRVWIFQSPMSATGSAWRSVRSSLSGQTLRYTGVAVGCFLVLVFVVSMVTRCSQGSS